MKICVFGAGAVGGHLAARLASGGHAVSIIARVATVDAVARDGLTLTSGPETIKAQVQAFTNSASAGPQDLVLVTVKATAASSIAEALPPLLGPQTPVIFVVNGIPWWYAHGLQTQELAQGLTQGLVRRSIPCPPMEFLDPGGRLAKSMDMARVIGSTVFSSNEVTAPGVIINRSPGLNTLTLGELDGKPSARVAAISAMLQATGFAAPVSGDIRKNVWTKLVSSNLSVLPICALVRQPMIVFSRNRQLLDLAKAIVREGLCVSAAAGYPLDLDADALFDQRRITTLHKPSMLQDMENGRALEIDAVLTAVQRFARAAGVPTPHLDCVTAIVAQQAADAGLYNFPKT